MNAIRNLEVTQRIKDLRKFYLENAPMSVNRDLVVWKCHRSRLLFAKGWLENRNAPTARIRRSIAEAYVLANTKPIIFPNELITGQPNLTPFTAEEEKLNKEYENVYEAIIEQKGRFDHLALDYQLLLDKGVDGILEIIEEKLSEIDITNGFNMQKYEFYYCCKIELEGFKTMCQSYASEAKAMADKASGKEKEELTELYEVLERVPLKPARTLREALQSIHMFTWSLYGIYSFGKPDTYLLPYYENDIKTGVLTIETAQELIDSFYLQSIPNMSAWAAEGLMLGGRDKNGNLVENDLTMHFLKAIEDTHLPDPNIGFCIVDETGSEYLEFAAKLIKDGHCQPQLWNSDEVTKSMLSYGYDQEAAYMFTLSTCVEVTPIGSSAVSITSPYMNTLKVFLDALDKCDDNSSYDDIFNAFKEEFKMFVKPEILQEHLSQLERGRNGTDPMRISVLVHDCLERELSTDSGGARYNALMPNLLGKQNVVESLNVIKRLVFDEKRLTLSEFKEILKNNYDGSEELLAYIKNKIPHFGTGDKEANIIAKNVADMMLDTFAPMITIRGAKVIPGAFSYRDHEAHGSYTDASPDGRLKGQTLHDGSSPVQGYDTLGPTLSLASTASWGPSRFLGGITINAKINKDVSIEKMIDLIKGFVKSGCPQLQFNIVDQKVLLDAQKHPENYPDLLVRIGGYSDFFVKIPKRLQDDVISRSVNNM